LARLRFWSGKQSAELVGFAQPIARRGEFGRVGGRGEIANRGLAGARELSGGMAQRVAVARALVRRPAVMLLDEPFSALDGFTRVRLQDHLIDLWRSLRFTLILVTHDLEEAIAVADRLIVMSGPPGAVIADRKVELPRPRERTGIGLQELRREIAAKIRQRLSPCATPAAKAARAICDATQFLGALALAA